MYRKNSNSWAKHWDFELIDILCLELSFFIAYGIRHIETEPVSPQMYLRLGIWLLAFDIITVLFIRSYKNILQRSKWQELAETIKHVSIVELMVLLYEYVTKEAYFFSRAVFLLSWAFAVLSCWVIRVSWKKALRHRITQKKDRSNMLVISSVAIPKKLLFNIP